MSPALVVADATGRLLALPAAGFLVQAKLAYRWLLDGRGGDDVHGFLCPSHHVSLLAGLAGALACGGVAAPLPLPADASGWGAPRALGVRVLLVRAKNLPPPPDAGAPPPSHPGPELVALEGESVAPRIYHWVKGGLFAQDTHVVQVLSRPEAGGFVAGPCPGLIPVRPASVSLPAPGLDLWVVDRAGQPCPVHHGGLLSLRQACPGLPLELQREKPPWVLGVRVRMDADNGLWPMGEWSPPRGPSATSLPELEAVLAAMPGVEQAAVVAYNDAQGILRTAAFVRLAPDGPDLDQVRERLRQRLGDASLPDSLQSVAQLPMSRTGKLLRSVLRRVARGEEIPIEELESVADPETLRPLLPQNVRPR
jgi:acyl-coenzyme A synthetase/AMP-(fatty) acid ligase